MHLKCTSQNKKKMFNYIENHSSRTRSNEHCTPRCTVLKKGFLLSLMSLKRTCVGQDGLT